MNYCIILSILFTSAGDIIAERRKLRLRLDDLFLSRWLEYALLRLMRPEPVLPKRLLAAFTDFILGIICTFLFF